MSPPRKVTLYSLQVEPGRFVAELKSIAFAMRTKAQRLALNATTHPDPRARDRSTAWSTATWRRRRDAECAVSRALGQRWTAEGAS